MPNKKNTNLFIDSGNLIAEGLSRLCAADADVRRLTAPRRDTIITLLEQYLAEIELFNPAYGLVGADSRQEIIIKHLLDSLAPLGAIIRLLEPLPAAAPPPHPAPPPAPQAADIGSGAGLPGIPLAIALPQVHFTLIERMGRRAGFLRNTQAVLALNNITIEERQMEESAPGRFSLITFRAFKPLEPALLRRLTRLCAAGGVLAAYKGRRKKLEAELAAAGQPLEAVQIIPYSVPLLREWGMGSGEWGVGSGEWGMGSGEWRVGNGEWGGGNREERHLVVIRR